MIASEIIQIKMAVYEAQLKTRPQRSGLISSIHLNLVKKRVL